MIIVVHSHIDKLEVLIEFDELSIDDTSIEQQK
jgi:hypothetical protein